MDQGTASADQTGGSHRVEEAAAAGDLLVVDVDLERCVGHGKCYGHAPEMFDPFDDEGLSKFDGEPIDPGDADRVHQAQVAITSCPEGALQWRATRGAETQANQSDSGGA